MAPFPRFHHALVLAAALLFFLAAPSNALLRAKTDERKDVTSTRLRQNEQVHFFVPGDSSSCADDPNFTFLLDGGGIANCAFFTESPDQIGNYCERTHIKYACPATCLEAQSLSCVCAEDEPGYTFRLLANNNEVSCDWITRNRYQDVTERRRSTYCYSSAGDQSASTEVGENCVTSCGFCKGTFPTPSNSPSVSPTDNPSNHPSECINEPNWRTSEMNGLSCAQIEQLALVESINTPIEGYDYCEKLSSIVWEGKSIKEACCLCGGSVFQNIAPSTSPSMSYVPSSRPSQSPSECIDEPGWEIHSGVTCADIESHNNYLSGYSWCDVFGQSIWNGKSAHEACCTCGGSDFETASPSSSPSSSYWREILDESYLPRPSSTVESINLGDDSTALVDLGFTYNWFGNPINRLRVSSNGQLNMDYTDGNSNCCSALPIGNYTRPRIAFVQEDLDSRYDGEVLVSTSLDPLSFKVTFDNVTFYGRGGYVQASVELFPDGDIIFCYGTGFVSDFNQFAAGVEDPIGGAFPLPFLPFDVDTGITDNWPEGKCWKFLMPYSLPSASPTIVPPSTSPTFTMQPSMIPSDTPSTSPSISLSPSVSSAPSYSKWREILDESYLPRPSSTVESINLGDDSTALVDLGFTYDWFGNPINRLRVSSNGQLNMDYTDDNSNCCSALPIGNYTRPRIAFVQEDLDSRFDGEVLVSTSLDPLSFKVTFDNVTFYGRGGYVQASVELFPDGDIIFCYGTGFVSDFNQFAAGVEDPIGGAFPLPFLPFDVDTGITDNWPEGKCWKFLMLYTLPPSAAPSLSLSPTVTSKPSAQSSPFSITLINTGSNTNFDGAFALAKARWESIIIGDLEDIPSQGFDWFDNVLSGSYYGEVDDVVIGYEISYIDGPNGILGYAGQTHLRNTGSPIAGIMVFDENDFASYSQTNVELIILHEMGHVLGLVGVSGSCASDCSESYDYQCPLAQQEYATFFPGSILKLENDGGLGTRCFHWDEESFPQSSGSSELMTGYFEQGIWQPISRVSVAALDESFADYVVDYDQADPIFGASSFLGDDHTKKWEVLRPTDTFSLEGRIEHITPVDF